MKKLIIIIILSSVCFAHAQTDDRETLKTINQNIAVAYKKQKFDDAAKFAKQAVDLNLKIYGTGDRQTAIAYENLGLIYQEDKKYKLSAENLQKAVEIYQKNEKQNGKDLVNAYEKLALSLYLNKSEKDAEINHLKSVETAELIFGKDSKESFQPVLSLANFYAKIGDLEKSQNYYLKSYSLAAKYFGRESSEFESVNIFQGYFSPSVLWSNDERYKDFRRKKSEILGYEIGDAVSLPKPPYPKIARQAGKKGTVVVKVWINEKGEVADVKTVFGEMFFASLVEEAARGAIFKPATQNSKPISITGFITYKFE